MAQRLNCIPAELANFFGHAFRNGKIYLKVYFVVGGTPNMLKGSFHAT